MEASSPMNPRASNSPSRSASGGSSAGPPGLSAEECAVIRLDKRGRREATVPTLFYMPNYAAVPYGNLLDANWKPLMLKRVLGNNFGEYERYVEGMGGGGGDKACVVGDEVFEGGGVAGKEGIWEEDGDDGGFFMGFS